MTIIPTPSNGTSRKDTQVPIDDLELLLNSGSEPREAWIDPPADIWGELPEPGRTR